MLVMSRKQRECFVVGGDGAFDRLLKVTVIEVGKDAVKLGIEVADDVQVGTLELLRQIIGATPQRRQALAG